MLTKAVQSLSKTGDDARVFRHRPRVSGRRGLRRLRGGGEGRLWYAHAAGAVALEDVLLECHQKGEANTEMKQNKTQALSVLRLALNP